MSLKLPWSYSRAPKNTFNVRNFHVPFSLNDSTKRYKALHVNLNRSVVESIFWALEQLHGSFSDIGARQDFQYPELFMTELLLTEL